MKNHKNTPDTKGKPGYNTVKHNFRVLGVEQVAKLLKIGKTTVYREINQKRLKAKKLGRRTVITPQDLSDYINNLEDYQGGQQNVY